MKYPLRELRELRAVRDTHPKCETCDYSKLERMCTLLDDEEIASFPATSEEVRARFYCASHSAMPIRGNEAAEDLEARKMDLFLNYGGPWKWDPTAVLVTGRLIVPPLPPRERPLKDDNEEDT